MTSSNFSDFVIKRYEPLNEESIKLMLNDLNKRFYGRWNLKIDEERCFKEIDLTKRLINQFLNL